MIRRPHALASRLGALLALTSAGAGAHGGLFRPDALRVEPTDPSHLVLRSDVYEIRDGFILEQAANEVPYVDLDGDYYKVVGEFEQRFPEGAPSLSKASALRVKGDWTFGPSVQILGDVTLETDAAQRVAAGTVFADDAVNAS